MAHRSTTPRRRGLLTVVPDLSPGHDVLPVRVQRALDMADMELASAVDAVDAAERFTHAHLAAIRCAAAVVELHGRPPARSQAKTVWEMLARVEPDLSVWSVYFASGAKLRAAIEAVGFSAELTDQRAAQLLAHAEDFRDEVGMVIQPGSGFAINASRAHKPPVTAAGKIAV